MKQRFLRGCKVKLQRLWYDVESVPNLRYRKNIVKVQPKTNNPDNKTYQ